MPSASESSTGTALFSKSSVSTSLSQSSASTASSLSSLGATGSKSSVVSMPPSGVVAPILNPLASSSLSGSNSSSGNSTTRPLLRIRPSEFSGVSPVASTSAQSSTSSPFIPYRVVLRKPSDASTGKEYLQNTPRSEPCSAVEDSMPKKPSSSVVSATIPIPLTTKLGAKLAQIAEVREEEEREIQEMKERVLHLSKKQELEEREAVSTFSYPFWLSL